MTPVKESELSLRITPRIRSHIVKNVLTCQSGLVGHTLEKMGGGGVWTSRYTVFLTTYPVVVYPRVAGLAEPVAANLFLVGADPLPLSQKCPTSVLMTFFYISSFMFFYFSYPSIRIFEAIIMIGNLVLGISDPRADQRLLSSAKNRWKNFKIKFKQLTRVSNLISNARNCLNVFQWLVF